LEESQLLSPERVSWTFFATEHEHSITYYNSAYSVSFAYERWNGNPKNTESNQRSSCELKGFLMARKTNQSGCNIEGLSDAEISAAIHYLDLDSSGENGAGSDSTTRGIWLSLMVLFFECAAFILLYYYTR
jgi:hypothetical protein